MLRRLGVLLSALLTLNLSAAEILRVCANESEHRAPVAAEHHGHHAPVQAPANENCEKPAQAKCCAAVSSCGPLVVIDGAPADSGVMPDRESASTGALLAPSALDRSPEPPPPKA